MRGSWSACRLAALLLILLGTRTATAQSAADQFGGWQVSAMGGWYSGSTLYVFHGSFEDKVRLSSSATFGLRLGYDFWPRWGLELSYSQARPDESFENHVPSFIRQIVMQTWELSSLVYLGKDSVRPFFVIGVGGASTGSSYGGTNFTTSVGVGVKAFLSPHFAVRAEGRFRGTYGNIGSTTDNSAFCDSYGCYSYNGSWYYNTDVSGGLSYAF